MEDYRKLTVSDLFAARQWLVFYVNTTQVTIEYVRMARKMLQEVDKEIWFRLISNDTPWGKIDDGSLKFQDTNFEETLKTFIKKEEKEEEKK